jgi:hypothetical protein
VEELHVELVVFHDHHRFGHCPLAFSRPAEPCTVVIMGTIARSGRGPCEKPIPHFLPK